MLKRHVLAFFGILTLVSACGGSDSVGDDADGRNLTGSDGGANGDGGTVPQCTDCPTLPLEVLGAANTTVDTTFKVEDPSKVASLWIQFHELDNEKKASLAINGGEFVTITNKSVAVQGAAVGFGGIGGAYHTLAVTMAVPPGALTAGKNTLHFRFNGTDGVSLGYRVIAYNILDAQGNKLLSPTADFAQDDPNGWTPPLPAASDIAAGENLWRTAQLIDSPLNTTPMLAHCTDCHAQDGRDLKYFNYSNLSIAERAKFHGLTQNQGDQIASYIRSLNVPNPGRVWNPPYQPGPALKNAPPANWSAGAGLDAVIDQESATSDVLVAAGATDPTKIFDGEQFIPFDTQNTPIPLQLLDWNRWLPNVAPTDSLHAAGSDFSTLQNDVLYLGLRKSLSGQNNGQTREQYLATWSFGSLALDRDLFNWANSMTYDAYGKLLPAKASDPAAWTAAQFNAVYSLGKWNAVKQWELMQEFGLENLQPSLYGANGPARAWFSNRHVFDASPAIIGRISTDALLSAQPAEGTPNNLALANQYLSNAWYQLQLVLNPGNRERIYGGHHTIDWGYMNGHFADLERAGKQGQPMRVAEFVLASFDAHDSSIGPEDSWFGWSLRNDVPTNLNLQFPEWANEPNAAAIVQAIYTAWLEKSGTFEQAQWKLNQNVQLAGDPNYPGDHVGGLSADGTNVGTDQWVVGDVSQGGNEGIDRSIADTFFRDLSAMKKLGVHPAVISASASFCKFMWPAPENAWDTFRAPTASETEKTSVTAIGKPDSVQVTWTPVSGATSYNVKRARPGDAAPIPVALLLTTTNFTDARRQAGQDYQYTVSANFADGEGPDSPPAKATPTGGLVARFTFNEASGNVLDDSGLANAAGLLQGGAGRASHGSGSALTLDGTGSVSFPMSLHRWLGNTVTVSMWIQTTQVGTGNKWETPGVIGAPYSATSPHDMTEYGILDPQGHIGALFTDQVSDGVYSKVAVNDGNWHHVAITRNATSGAVQIYVDGALSNSGTGGKGVLIQRVYSIGHLDFTGSASSWKGAIDDLEIYDGILSAGEIAALNSSGAK